MDANRVVPVEVAAGFRFESVHPMPEGEPTIVQLSGMLPVNPFSPFTRMVSVMLVPTLVDTVAVLAVTEKSFTESVTLFERVTPRMGSNPLMAIVLLLASAVPKVVESVTTDWYPFPGFTIAGTGVQVTPAGSVPQLTVMSSVIPPSGVYETE